MPVITSNCLRPKPYPYYSLPNYCNPLNSFSFSLSLTLLCSVLFYSIQVPFSSSSPHPSPTLLPFHCLRSPFLPTTAIRCIWFHLQHTSNICSHIEILRVRHWHFKSSVIFYNKRVIFYLGRTSSGRPSGRPSWQSLARRLRLPWRSRPHLGAKRPRRLVGPRGEGAALWTSLSHGPVWGPARARAGALAGCW